MPDKMPDLLSWLVNADTAMVAVTFFIVQVIKRFVPSPPVEIPGAKPNPWDVVTQLQWLPLCASFTIGVALSVLFDPDKGQALVPKVREGLQTGAYSVAVWEIYSSVVKPLIDKLRGVAIPVPPKP